VKNNEGTENQQTTPSAERWIDSGNQLENFEPEMIQVTSKVTTEYIGCELNSTTC